MSREWGSGGGWKAALKYKDKLGCWADPLLIDNCQSRENVFCPAELFSKVLEQGHYTLQLLKVIDVKIASMALPPSSLR